MKKYFGLSFNASLFIILILISGCSDNKKVGKPTTKPHYITLSSDSFYVPTGFYHLTDGTPGIGMKQDDERGLVYELDSVPFVSVNNVTEVRYMQADGQRQMTDEICLILDDKGLQNLGEGTGNSVHPKMAVVLANHLLYVVETPQKITSKEMCILIADYSKDEQRSILAAIKKELGQ